VKAARLAEFSGPDALAIADVPAPVPGPGQIRVQVRATALNRADLLQTMGLYPAPPGVPADIPGLEFAGVVETIGAGVTRWQVGERVMGLVAGGAWAEQLVTHEREALRIPGQLSFEQAAAIPEAFITAFDALTLQGGMRAGHTVLIHAVGSGVGTAAVQWAKAIGARTIGTARTASKLERVKPLGLDVGLLVDGGAPAFADQVKADIALDLVGGNYLPETLEAMAQQGVVMVVGLTAGITAEVSLRTILARRLRVQGTTLRSRNLEEKIAVAEAFSAQVLPYFAAGKLIPVVGAVAKLTELREALHRLAANETFGKTVVTL
jgi:NADPH2:quinone reductase